MVGLEALDGVDIVGCNALSHIVHEVNLAAVDDLDGLASLLQVVDSVVRLGEGLHHSVIRDGQGGMAPVGGLL